MGDPICERLLTQKTSLCLQEKPMRFLARPGNFEYGLSSFCETAPSRFPLLTERLLKFGIPPLILVGSPSNQINSRPSHHDTFVFTHPPLPGFGIRQNFGSLKTLQFNPPTSSRSKMIWVNMRRKTRLISNGKRYFILPSPSPYFFLFLFARLMDLLFALHHCEC